MSSIIKKLQEAGSIRPPSYVYKQIQYECMMGSIAYGVSNDTSDIDVYGFCIPNKDMIFPHLRGIIPGFGRQYQKFNQFQQHHIKDPDGQNKEYDVAIYNIVQFFQLCMDNNPNMIDSLFVPRRCVLYSSKISETIRESRKLFLHKGSWHKFKGYSFSQMHKMESKAIREYVDFCNDFGFKFDIDPDWTERYLINRGHKKEADRFKKLVKLVYQNGQLTKRVNNINKYGYDVKFAYHVVRLLNEVEQILIEHDLDLERNREQLKSIRRGEWTIERVQDYFAEKEKALEQVYIDSSLPHGPNEEAIKELFLNCLEEHFGNLSGTVVRENKIDLLVDEMDNILNKYR